MLRSQKRLRLAKSFLSATTLCVVWLAPPRLSAADAGDVIRQARELSSQKHRDKALRLLEDFLEDSEDGDVRLVYGLMLSWDGKYDQARRELKTVLLEHPGYTDAARALTNVELWSDHPDAAEKLTDRFLEREPDDRDLSVQRVRSLRALKRRKEALALLTRVLIVSPGDTEALDLQRAVRQEDQAWQTVFGQYYTWFSDGSSPWSEQTISLKRGANAGSTIFRFSRSNRFGLSSSQIEADSYPHLWKGAYGYLNAGFSPDRNLYPAYRFGADVYQNLSHGWEGSGGFRRLIFASTRITVYTGMLGRYHANWFFSGRTFLTPDDTGLSRSIQLQARRYLGDGGRQLTFRYSMGASPFEIRSLNEVGILNSSSVAMDFNWYAGKWLMSATGGWAREDRLNRERQGQYNLGVTVSRRF